MSEDDWPETVRVLMERFPTADVVMKAYPQGFPHDEPFVAVAALVQDEAGNALLVRHSAGTPWRESWATPGGLVRGGESPEDAIRREILEECGVAVAQITLRRVVVMEDTSAGDGTTSFTLIFGSHVKAGGKLKPREGDLVQEARWFSRLPEDMAFREEYVDLVR